MGQPTRPPFTCHGNCIGKTSDLPNNVLHFCKSFKYTRFLPRNFAIEHTRLLAENFSKVHYHPALIVIHLPICVTFIRVNILYIVDFCKRITFQYTNFVDFAKNVLYSCSGQQKQIDQFSQHFTTNIHILDTSYSYAGLSDPYSLLNKKRHFLPKKNVLSIVCF